MSSSSLFIKDGDVLKPKQDCWKVIRKVGETYVPSPIGSASIYLPTVVAIGPNNQQRFFQQVSPKFWLMVNHE
jgi:hypothetical protein